MIVHMSRYDKILCTDIHNLAEYMKQMKLNKSIHPKVHPRTERDIEITIK